MNRIYFIMLVLFLAACNNTQNQNKIVSLNNNVPFVWENANVYFLLTDRFFNGNSLNDTNFNRTITPGPERGFQGGDFKGITQKINEGYFNKLGVTALWFSPVFEQIHGGVDEGQGFTYAFHGYWTRDFSSIEPNFGTEDEFAELVDAAHANGIRIIMDVIINHTGPVTNSDPFWGDDWVRNEPQCNYQDYKGTVECTLVKNLPDIKTESEINVEIPQHLIDKWVAENRLQQEMESLDDFFIETGYPRAPKYYIIKWLVDFIKKFGIDGFRLDTVKHTESDVWAELYKQAKKAFEQWKEQNPEKVLDDNEFYMIGEVYGYGISNGQNYNNGGVIENYFENGIQSLINFEFKWHAQQLNYQQLFSLYDSILNNSLKNYSVLNYLTSHDDGQPFDPNRDKAIEGGTKLLLCPGKSQIYYGDESLRNLKIDSAKGDATLRGFMNWPEIEQNISRGGNTISNTIEHYKKLGIFRANNPAVGAGKHKQISNEPYIFSRTFSKNNITNNIIVALNINIGQKNIPINNVFTDGTKLVDYYSGTNCIVKNNCVNIDTNYDIVLLGLQQ